MDPIIAQAVQKSTTDLFTTMMAMNITAETATNDRACLSGVVAITGMIGLAGAYKGAIAIHFSKALALKSITAMLGMEITELSGDTQDAIGEIANIIAGGIKTELAPQGISFDLSLPSIISGENYSVFMNDSQKADCMGIIPFAFEGEKMFVEFDLQKAVQ